MDKPSSDFAQGRVFDLEVRSATSRIWLGPAWAVLCGAVASGGLELDWHTIVALLLAMLLADSLLGSVWSVVDSNLQVAEGAATGNPGSKTPAPSLPYTLPGSASARFAEFLSKRTAWWRSTVWPQKGNLVLGLAFNSLLALLVSALLGGVPLLLTAVALAFAGCRLVLRRSRQGVGLALGSCFLGGLPWLLGYATFRDLGSVGSELGMTGEALAMAAIYALAYHAYQVLSIEGLSSGAALLNLAHVTAAAMLIAVKQPILAGCVALLFLPQLLLQPALLTTGDGLGYLRQVQAPTMAAMMVTALATAV